MRRIYCAFIYTLLVICSANITQAQEMCASESFLAERLKNDKGFAKWYQSQIDMEKIDPSTRSFIACNTSNSVVIPVAVHYNLPITCEDPACLLSQAEAQIATMNEDFMANNADLSLYTTDLNSACSSTYPLSTAPTAGSGTCVQFCLASQNHPACSELNDGEPAITVGQYTWQTRSEAWTGYLNIYVSGTGTAGLAGGTAGISFLPGSANGDGFFVRNDMFGAPSTCSSGGTMGNTGLYSNGRVAVHEAGHYLGLPHVFSGAGQGCIDNDINPPGPFAINDTPIQDNNSTTCPTVTSCTDVDEDCPDEATSFYSFMDYTNDDCMVMFTEDQSVVINYWANELTWASDATVCGALSETEAICISCDDGIKNRDEQGIDCGGAYCAPCTSSCDIDFTDPGGTCVYNNNDIQVYTFCPDNANEILTISFSAFDVEEKVTPAGECWDWLKVFAGSDTSAPQIGGEFCGNTVADAPGGGTLVAPNAGDCLTFEFTTDNFIVETGWLANVTCEAVLPVDLLTFSAIERQNSIHLDWKTANEVNNEGFELLRREGATGNFEKITFIPGSGTHSGTLNYGYNDKEVFRNLQYYYKLRQLDFNGKFVDSEIVSATLDMESGSALNIHPNPTNGDYIQIKFSEKPAENTQVKIYTMDGKLLLDQKWSTNRKHLDISQLTTGVYLVKIISGNSLITTQKLMKI